LKKIHLKCLHSSSSSSSGNKTAEKMAQPPSYEEAVNSLSFHGKEEDFALAARLVSNSTILAALRPTEDATNMARVSEAITVTKRSSTYVYVFLL
jgi:hypothetical protein